MGKNSSSGRFGRNVGIPLRPTEASKTGKSYMAANGSKIANFGEKKVVGYTDDWTGISMTMQCADVRKTLASVHRMNQGGNKVILDGVSSCILHKATGNPRVMPKYCGII